MKTVGIGSVTIGEGVPKICVPIMSARREQLLRQAEAACRVPCDLVEWRADALPPAQLRDLDFMIESAEAVRQRLDKPLLLTLRTEAEGGLVRLDRREYYSLLRDLSTELDVDAVDIEAFDEQQGFNGEKIEFLTSLAHEAGRTVLLSSHQCDSTPDLDVMVRRLLVMQELGADLPKIAVMPQSDRDVLDLLEAARVFHEHYARGPFIALAMGARGQVSRICGGSFGSAVSFAAGGEENGLPPSAPGQMDAALTRACICEYYRDTV
ncbi:MAG: type I 3-dehydroquinate dehydratase [Anaerovoracaceae bacterium]